MSSPGDGVGGTPDVRGRTVVWSAGTPAAPQRRRSAVLRWAGFLVVAAVSSFALAYAVHAYVVVPLPPGPAAPLWLPDRLPADDAADRAPLSRPTATRTAEPGDAGAARATADDDSGSGSGRDDASGTVAGCDGRGSSGGPGSGERSAGRRS